jgi:phosphomannomutase
MQVTASIFKAYDIRGIVPSTINESMAEALGKAFGSTALAEGEKSVAVGRDGRLSGPTLTAALIRGLVASGIEVIDTGMVTTPILYFAANTLCKSGIQVTGSHNPKDYNGFKMVLAGRAIYGDEIQSLRRMMEDESWKLQVGGSVRTVDVVPAYMSRITSDIKAMALPELPRRRCFERWAARSLSSSARLMATSRITTPIRASPRI